MRTAAEPDRGGTPASGSTSDMARLYTENRVKLHRVLARRLGSNGEAEDVMHEAFTRFLSAYGTKVIANPLAMLYRIAVNIVRDGRRSHGLFQARVLGQNESICAAPPEIDPETTASSRQRLRRLQTAIDDLPPRCREVFLLHKIDGLPHSKVADLLGISPAAVEKHVMRAYQRLRAEMREEAPKEVDKAVG